MNKEIYDAWNNACNNIRKAEYFLKIGDVNGVENEAKKAILNGFVAAKSLLDANSYSVVIQSFIEANWNPNTHSADIILRIKKFLREIANVAPPEVMLPPPPV